MKNDCLVQPKIQFTETSGLSSDSKYQTKELAELHKTTKATKRFISAFKFDLKIVVISLDRVALAIIRLKFKGRILHKHHKNYCLQMVRFSVNAFQN